MLLPFSIRVTEWPPVWIKYSVYQAYYIFHERLSVCVCASFSFGFEGKMWDLIVLVPDHCLCFHFTCDTHRLSSN